MYSLHGGGMDIFWNHTIHNILLTKREGRTGRISALGLDSVDRVQRGPYRKDQGPIFSQYGPEQAWLTRDLLHDFICLKIAVEIKP